MTDLDNGAELRVLMARTLTDLPTPTERLYDGAVRQGRPLRRRRRAGSALAAAAVVAALAAVAVPLVGGTGATTGGVAVEPDPPPVQPLPFVAHPGWWDMPAREMHQRLVALLPDDVGVTAYEKVNTDHGPGESNQFSGVLLGTLRDATDVGPGSIEIMLLELPQDPAALADVRDQHLSCDLDDWDLDSLDRPVKCETSDLHSGRPYQRTVTYVAHGVHYTEVRRWTDGGEIYAAVANSTQRKWGPPASAHRAPLTARELTAVVGSSSWITE